MAEGQPTSRKEENGTKRNESDERVHWLTLLVGGVYQIGDVHARSWIVRG
jgi:hypothetical protein